MNDSNKALQLLQASRLRILTERAAANMAVRNLTVTIEYLDKAIAELTFDPIVEKEERW